MGAAVTVGVVAKRGAGRARDLARSLASTLESDDVTVVLDELTAEAIDAPVESASVAAMDACDLVVSIGGDGTFLFVAREVGSTPVVGVNLGEVGFLTAVSPGETVETVMELVETLRSEGDLDSRSVPRLRAEGVEADWRLQPAFNEVVVQGARRGPAGGATLTVSVDGNQYLSTRADGVVVATAAGSTAYNLSEGGPIVGPELAATVVTVQSAEDSMPPLVVAPDRGVTVSIQDTETAYAIADGRNRECLAPPASVSIGPADDPVRLVGPRVDFFRALDKLD